MEAQPIPSQTATQPDVNTPSTAEAQAAAQTAAQAAESTTAEATAAETAAVDPIAQLTAQLAESQAKATEHYDAFLRANAEMQNIRRRAQEDVTKAHKFAIESFAEALVPVMDSLHAALADSSADVTKVREGVELTLKQLVSAFEKGKIIEQNPLGEKFDPHKHQAIAMVPAEQEANTVVAVLQRGYTIAERVLRPALVTVSQPK